MELPKAEGGQPDDVERLEVEGLFGEDAHEGLLGLLDASGTEQPAGFLGGIGHRNIPVSLRRFIILT